VSATLVEFMQFIVDVEGIGAAKQAGEDSTRILSLAVFASSLLLFNQKADISESMLTHLDNVAKVAERIQKHPDLHLQGGPCSQCVYRNRGRSRCSRLCDDVAVADMAMP
jgi:Guanylate-binding protein, N-terminal domain